MKTRGLFSGTLNIIHHEDDDLGLFFLSRIDSDDRSGREEPGIGARRGLVAYNRTGYGFHGRGRVAVPEFPAHHSYRVGLVAFLQRFPFHAALVPGAEFAGRGEPCLFWRLFLSPGP